ncbi:flagellar basal body rod protein FlgB [Paenibacillus marinisediminis]
MDLLGSTSFKQLESAIQASSARHQVITNNIANVETPYFKRSDVEFESLLRNEMNESTLKGTRTDSRHFYIGPSQSIPEYRIVQDESTVMGNNQNNVDIDVEAAKQAENQLRYNTYIQQANHHINMMRTAIDSRR